MCFSKFLVYLIILFELQIRAMTFPQYSNDSIHDLSNARLQDESADVEESDDDGEFKFLVTGGYRPSDKTLVKYLASIRTNREQKFFGDNHFCGGVIISKRAILTAAHCMFDSGGSKVRPHKLRVVVGTPKRLQKTTTTQIKEVDKTRVHPKYSSRLLKNDIAIVKLKNDIEFDGESTDSIKYATTEAEAGTKASVVGWGTVIQFGPTPDEAVYGDLTVFSEDVCKKMEGFSKGMICAGDPFDHEVDSCQGDSGGPLISDNVVIGIVSYGYGCGEPNSAGVYSDVNYFRDWIKENHAVYCKSHCTWFLLITTVLSLIFI